MTTRKLYIFAISHYCEKARWALEYLDIPYEPHFLAPGAHIFHLKKLGLKRTTVPVLQTPDQIIQGSNFIVDWADKFAQEQTQNGPVKSLAPNPTIVDPQEAAEFEKRLDRISGVQLRRYFYSEALVQAPQTVYPLLQLGLNPTAKRVFRLTQPLLRRLMIKGMDLGKEQALESKHILETELDWLDQLLSDGRDFLLGESFSRVDLTAAALFAPFVQPPEYQLEATPELTPALLQTQQEWQQRPFFKWVKEIYRCYR